MVTATLNSKLVKQLEVNIKSRLIVQNGQNTSSISKGSARDKPPPIGPIFSIPCSFRGKMAGVVGLHPYLWGWLPPLENPRSANKTIVKYRKFGQN